MRLASVAVPLALLALAGTAAASHAPLSIPQIADDDPVDPALQRLAGNVSADGCVDQEGCVTEKTKWVATTAAHLGVDPNDWPADGAAIGGWLRANADDLADERMTNCHEDENRSRSDCAHLRVFSRVKSILAFEALGEDARKVPTPDGGQRDLVAELLEEHDGSEFGRSDLANDDVWALIALNDAGYDGPEVDDAIDRIERAQSVDGGVPHGEGSLATVDVTASAIMALAAHDRTDTIEAALGYLADERIDEGVRRACWPLSSAFGGDPNVESTARVVQALRAAGEDPLAWGVDGQTPTECLLTFQTGSGDFKHAGNSRTTIMSTQQALGGLSWRPWGTLEGPAEPLTVTDEATVGEEHTATVPDAQLRLGTDATAQHTWTPEEPGQSVFHGFTSDHRPLELVVDVQEASDDGASSSSTSSSGSSSPDDDGSTGSTEGSAPTAHLEAPARAERNVTLTVNVSADPAQAAVTGFRLEIPGYTSTDWRPNGSFQVTLTDLGEHALRAWARDADGHVSDPAEATITARDAQPRLSLEGPTVVNRSTRATLTAHAHDPDGPTPNVTWTGPGGDHQQGAQATISFADPGRHAVHAQARDEANNTANATWTVHARNRAPTNLTVTPAGLEANTTAVLEADAIDPDGDAIEIAWRLADEDEPSSWGGQRHLETGPPGERELVVNVSDAHGGWTRARLKLPVREQPGDEPRSPITNLTTDAPTPDPSPALATESDPATVSLPDRITLPANTSRVLHLEAHSPTQDVVNVTVRLEESLPVRGTDEARALIPELSPGTYELTARAADPAGWGPWTNATLVVEPTPREPIEPTRSTPAETSLGLVATLVALLLAGRRRP
ncbi:hypothetical protein BRD56_07745 [Thermoplasmatales archaeon SW_10_69_26]|nr:MAG: hypothetical protein BRD56_07745 [Thermoplasmatales archaeon SW_10_69_26]